MVRSMAFHLGKVKQRAERGKDQVVAWAFAQFKTVKVSEISPVRLQDNH